MQCNDLTTQTKLSVLYTTIANGNTDAYKFVVAWQHYCHGIDDIVDGEIKDTESIVAIFFTAAALYNSNFWIANKDSLYNIVAIISNDYIDSNNPTMPQKDFLRSTGNNMLKAVAFITGGWELLRKVSPIINQLSYAEHHDLQTGEPH